MPLYEKGSFGYFLELAKKDGFDNLHDWNEWRKENGKMRSLQDIETERVQKMGFKDIKKYRENLYIKKGFKSQKEYDDHLARNKGFEDKKERNRIWHYDRGSFPMSDNIDCSEYLGVYIAERKIARKILLSIFGNIDKEMPYGNPGFDFICSENKIDVKSISIDNLQKLKFHVRWNRIATYFLFIGFENRDNEKIIGIWLIQGDEKIRNSRNKSPGNKIKLRNRESFVITYKEEYLLQFKRYDITDKFVKNGVFIL